MLAGREAVADCCEERASTVTSADVSAAVVSSDDTNRKTAWLSP
jgi:hypothetical protein